MNTDNQNTNTNSNSNLTDPKDFNFTAITWKDVTDKVNFQVIEDLLNERLTLADYGEAVKNLYGTFLVIQANNEFHDEFVDYDTEEQILEMAFKVDIRLLKDATEAETIQRLAKAFLTYIRQYPSIEGFDSNRFYTDVQSAFEEKGWLVETDSEIFISDLSLTEKAQITGLEEAIVHLIETDIDKAALGWIKVYCEKLEVKFQELIPEFFT